MLSKFEPSLLDLFENKISGIFSQLDDECKMLSPKTQNFMLKVISIHGESPSISQIRAQDSHSGFVIQHFAQKVSYTAVRIPQYICIHTIAYYDLLNQFSICVGQLH